jgi:hypothetical protein
MWPVVHGVSAAWWQDLGPKLPATVEVTVPRRRVAAATTRRQGQDLAYRWD